MSLHSNPYICIWGLEIFGAVWKTLMLVSNSKSGEIGVCVVVKPCSQCFVFLSLHFSRMSHHGHGGTIKLSLTTYLSSLSQKFN